MATSTYEKLDPIFHPRSVALAGVTVSNPDHWTRTFLDSLLEFKFGGKLYLVNPKGGEIKGLKVYPRIEDIPENIDYVISTVPAKAAPGLIDECAAKGVKAVHFCTAGFSETGEGEGVKLEAELVQASRRTGIRIIGPNGMGIYCPESRLSFQTSFAKESGTVGFISQSGGNATILAGQAAVRGIRFSKVISYGNACDLNESDFLKYLTADPDTEIIALYIEGIKDGGRFRQALSEAARKKAVILLKGGVTEGGARAVAGHTGALAGSEVTWDSLCKQLGVIRVHSLQELSDVLVTLQFMPTLKGRRAAVLGGGGGASVLITDEFVKRGLEVPPLPEKLRDEIRSFTPIAGNILRNPIDYSQTMVEFDKLARTVKIIFRWGEADLVVGYLIATLATPNLRIRLHQMVDVMLAESKANSKPLAMVLESSIAPEVQKDIFAFIQKCVSSGISIYYSFSGAANAINLVLSHHEKQLGRSSA